MLLCLCERDQVAGGRALAALGEHTFGPDAVVFSREFGEGLMARVRGDAAAAQNAFEAARAQQEKVIYSQGDYAPSLCVLGVIDAGLGRKEDAVREGRRAVELLPVEKDTLNGVRVREFLAVIYAWIGEKDLACEQIGGCHSVPRQRELRSAKPPPFLGFTPGRSALRSNRRLARAEGREVRRGDLVHRV